MPMYLKSTNIYLTNNSDFFINEPEISLDGIKNIGTVFTGKYVTLNYKKGDFQTSFKDKNLSQKDNVNDLEITLKANSLGSVTKNQKFTSKILR